MAKGDGGILTPRRATEENARRLSMLQWRRLTSDGGRNELGWQDVERGGDAMSTFDGTRHVPSWRRDGLGRRTAMTTETESRMRRTCRQWLPALATSLCCIKDGSTTGNGEMGAMGWRERDGGGGRDDATTLARIRYVPTSCWEGAGGGMKDQKVEAGVGWESVARRGRHARDSIRTKLSAQPFHPSISSCQHHRTSIRPSSARSTSQRAQTDQPRPTRRQPAKIHTDVQSC
ncbi:hypothetical protein SCHPADRAFT_722869 [Schizopora paradoxa]|uniref:Uncharacterized protein n=1 Tax=Schizopora paradoxa TaxID=27342 RepID=A0A0H2R7R4_9AGAM|nr:hypothetical protein SCHPADRAFT_722869 [Schizopora paradoxa]